MSEVTRMADPDVSFLKFLETAIRLSISRFECISYTLVLRPEGRIAGPALVIKSENNCTDFVVEKKTIILDLSPMVS